MRICISVFSELQQYFQATGVYNNELDLEDPLPKVRCGGLQLHWGPLGVAGFATGTGGRALLLFLRGYVSTAVLFLPQARGISEFSFHLE